MDRKLALKNDRNAWYECLFFRNLSKRINGLFMVVTLFIGIVFIGSMVALQGQLDAIVRLVPARLLEQIKTQAGMLGKISEVRTRLETFQQTGSSEDAAQLVLSGQQLKEMSGVLKDDGSKMIEAFLEKIPPIEGDVIEAVQQGASHGHKDFEVRLEALYQQASTLLDRTTTGRIESLKAQRSHVADLRLFLMIGIAIVGLLTLFLLWLFIRDRRLRSILELRVEERTAELSEKNIQLEQSINDLKSLQQRALFQEKMASLGKVTASIAHELKNPLNFIKNFSELSEEIAGQLQQRLELELSAEQRADLSGELALLQVNATKVMEHANRANDTIKAMQLHARDSEQAVEIFELNKAVDGAVDLAVQGLKAKDPGFSVVVKRQYDAEHDQVEGAPQELGRVLINLLDNACYAAGQKDQKTPEVRVETESKPGLVLIRIHDNGSGIPAEVREKIFLPFYTTKPAGEGTGLGLSICYDIIVNQFRGSLEVNSQDGVYTEFVISLPQIK